MIKFKNAFINAAHIMSVSEPFDTQSCGVFFTVMLVNGDIATSFAYNTLDEADEARCELILKIDRYLKR